MPSILGFSGLYRSIKEQFSVGLMIQFLIEYATDINYLVNQARIL
ncbi:hypothetical protein [Rickettsia prowazekii]|nr:hypothetical protein [Rickettsia prowazekii]AGJ01510.1 DNA translocase FtsK [Rickettsia prowazekii str. NMRC Madrid E]AGJ02924.1 hypothetical protein H375_6990 [Rickettsia prowazekii str. Breinl]EOB09393.1 hypothetical protein H377_6970 [Rickettsia prowazekii str. Cairo 3]EOB10251.1 hypothetical protein H376_3990 [Rickettsia prowazekii str. GvF12]